MHKSYLEFGCHVQDLLLKGISVTTAGGMIGLCVGVAVFTFIYEGVKALRQQYTSSSLKNSIENNQFFTSAFSNHSETQMLVEMDKWPSNKWKIIKRQVVNALLYMAQVTMGYMLMLIIMSYNAWLAITIFSTAGVSYYFFSTYVLGRPSVIPVEILAPDECAH